MPKLETIKNIHTPLIESHILGTKAESFWSSETSEYFISVIKEILHKPLYGLASIPIGSQIQVLREANHFTLKQCCSWEQDGLSRWEEQEVLAATLQSILPFPTGEKEIEYSRVLVTGQRLFGSHTSVTKQPVNCSSVSATDRVAAREAGVCHPHCPPVTMGQKSEATQDPLYSRSVKQKGTASMLPEVKL